MDRKPSLVVQYRNILAREAVSRAAVHIERAKQIIAGGRK